MRDRRWITFLLLALMILCLSTSLNAAREEEDKLIGTKAKDFTLPELFGNESVTLSSFEGKKPVVLNFFEVWASACRKNLPLVEDFYTAHKGDVEVFIITMAKDRDVLEEFFTDEENKVSFDVLYDKMADTKDDYPHDFIPYMVVIGKDGVIIDTHSGYDPDLVEYLEGVLGLE